MEVRNEECDAITELFEASMKGCVTTLNTLIEKHPLILDKISLTSFGETPLHISALFGHLPFTTALLDRKSQLAMELDSFKRLPLHLASVEGHTEIVKALLNANKNANFVRDQEGRIPLHYAVMTGRVDVVRELISTIVVLAVVLDGGKSSVLHLCVKFNHLEVLKAILVDQSMRDNEVFLNLQDGESGNTILHLAVMQRQIETVKYLLTIPKVKARANVMNQKGFTALEISKHEPKDDKSSEIRNILEQNHESEKPAACLLLWFDKIIRWLGNLRYQGNWVEETRGPLMVVATVITTMTFQPSIAPPGGVWGECTDTNTTHECEAGTSVLAKELPDGYFRFMVVNTTAFIASISVVLLLISGFPLKNKVFMWILTFAMFTSLTFTALAYLYVIKMMVPSGMLYYYFKAWHNLYNFIGEIFYIWIGFVALVLGIHSIRLLALLVMKRHGILASLKARISGSPNGDQPRNGIQLTSTSV